MSMIPQSASAINPVTRDPSATDAPPAPVLTPFPCVNARSTPDLARKLSPPPRPKYSFGDDDLQSRYTNGDDSYENNEYDDVIDDGYENNECDDAVDDTYENNECDAIDGEALHSNTTAPVFSTAVDTAPVFALPAKVPASPQIVHQPQASDHDLPAALRTDGIVQSVIARTRDSSATVGAWQLHQKISSDLMTVRSRYRHELSADPLSPADARYTRALTTGVGHSGAEPVWRYCLARRDKLKQASDSLEQAAWQAYLPMPAAYDHILSELIPADFRDQVRRHLDWEAYTAGTNATAADDWQAYRRSLIARRDRPLLGLSSGIPTLDAALGGLRGLTFIGGGPGVGKTTLGLTMAIAALRAHKDLAVLFASLDMPKSTLYDRIVCHEANITYDKLLGGALHGADIQRVNEANKRLVTEILPRLRIIEHEQFKEQKVFNALVHEFNMLIDASDCARGMMVIDYFQLLAVKGKDLTPLESDYRRIEDLQLAQTHMALDCILVVSEVRKGDGGRTSLTMEDLLGSSRISYGADAILLLEEERAGAGSSGIGTVPLILNVAKGRDGMTRDRIRLTFDYERYQFCDRSEEERVASLGPKATATAAQSKRVDPLAGGPGGGRR